VGHLYFGNLMNGQTKDVTISMGKHNVYTVWWEANDIVAYYIAEYIVEKDDSTSPRRRRHVRIPHEEVHRVRVPEF